MRTLACGLLGLLALPVWAAPPSVETLAPPLGQRGTEFSVKLTGARLSSPQELLFYRPGLTCTKLEARSENEVLATLRSTSDSPLGEYPFRLRTVGGTSELRLLHLTPLPTLAEVEPNDQPAQAQAIALDKTVLGVIESTDVDSFRVTLKKGERLTAEVQAIRFGGELFDAVLTILGPDGQVLAECDDSGLFRQDPFLSLTAPVDGHYTLTLRDTAYGGGPDFWYALHVGHFPRVPAVYPVGGEAGTETTVQLVGMPEARQTVTLPNTGAWFPLHVRQGEHVAPTAQPFRIAPFPNVLESESGEPPVSVWPVAFNGILDRLGDVDRFRFRARKDDVIDIEAYAYRVGSLVDPVVSIFNSRGELVGLADDDATHDSRLTLTIPAEDVYTLEVKDKRGDGGPAHVYRVELAAPQPRLEIFLASPARKSQDQQVLMVPRGNKITAFLAVRREDGDGEVRIAAAQLPRGVRMSPVIIPPGRYFAPVVLEADADAPLAGVLTELHGEMRSSRGTVTGRFVQKIDLIQGPGDSAFCSAEVHQLAVVVVPEVPLQVRLHPVRTTLTADGALDIKVSIVRGKGMEGAIQVSVPSLPPGVEAAPLELAAGQTEGLLQLSAQPGVELGEWPLVAVARPAPPKRSQREMTLALMQMIGAAGPGSSRTRLRDGVRPVASEAATLRVATPKLRATCPPTAGEQGKTVTVRFDLNEPLAAGTALDASLLGLPPRAATKNVSLKEGANSVRFEVTLDATTPVGEFDTLLCELRGIVEGHPVLYRVGRGGVLTVYPAGGIQTGPGGKPLSPLEALRQQNKPKK